MQLCFNCQVEWRRVMRISILVWIANFPSPGYQLKKETKAISESNKRAINELKLCVNDPIQFVSAFF